MIELMLQPIVDKLSGVNFFDQFAGVVTPFDMINADGSTQTIPLTCDSILQSCKSSPYSRITPDDNYKSLIYLEVIDPISITRSKKRLLEIDTTINLVAWFNNNKLGVSPYCMGQTVMSVQLQRLLNFNAITENSTLHYKVISDITHTYNPFEKYDSDFLRAIIAPYFYVVLQLEITGVLGLDCIEEYMPQFMC